MFRGARDGVEVVCNVVKGNGLLGLLQTERGADLQLNLQNETGAAEAAQGRNEELGVILPRTADFGAIGKEDDE